MFNPTKTWRRWHRKTNVTQKRHALAAAISATGVPALVMARGHQIDSVPELPLVVSDAANKIEKTKDAVALLCGLGIDADLEKVKESKKIRAGRGKARNRRYVMRKGPLIVHNLDKETESAGASLAKSFRNIPGVDICHVDRLNLLQLAPGGAFGRLVVYTEGAVKRLAQLYGTYKGGSVLKKGYTLPRSVMTNTDISRIINSNEIQSVLCAKKEPKVVKASRQRKNPLKNASVLGRLSPWALTVKKLGAKAHVRGSAVQKMLEKKSKRNADAAKKWGNKSREFYKQLQSAYAVAPKEEQVEEEE